MAICTGHPFFPLSIHAHTASTHTVTCLYFYSHIALTPLYNLDCTLTLAHNKHAHIYIHIHTLVHNTRTHTHTMTDLDKRRICLKRRMCLERNSIIIIPVQRGVPVAVPYAPPSCVPLFLYLSILSFSFIVPPLSFLILPLFLFF